MMFPEYEEYRAYISAPEVRAAFEYLMREAGRLKDYVYRPKPHGYMNRNIHFYKNGKAQFSIVIAKNWLLFYPISSISSNPNFHATKLSDIFRDVKELKGGGTNFRIYNTKEAEELVLRFFEILPQPREITYADEVDEEKLYEGAIQKVAVNKYERNSVARSRCIEHYGFTCSVCHFDFEKTYGAIGRQYIHVHHLVEISNIGEEYVVDPIKDLRPVCPNCHAMLHRKNPAYEINELKEYLTRG